MPSAWYFVESCISDSENEQELRRQRKRICEFLEEYGKDRRMPPAGLFNLCKDANICKDQRIIQKQFRAFDKDEDGFLNYEEFKAFITSIVY